MRVRRILTFFPKYWIISILALFPLFVQAGITAAPNDAVPAAETPAFPFESAVVYDFDKFPVSGLSMINPSVITTHYEYDPDTGNYIMTRRIGDMVIGRPVYISFDDFLQYDLDTRLQNYWNEKSKPQAFQRRDGLIPEIYIGGELFDRIFGGSTIDIRPSGSAELIFGVMSNYREDPSLDEQRRRTTNFDFQQKIQFAVEANIGTKVSMGAAYNTEATFDFENRMKLEYRGTEDEIVQLIEAGDVTLPLAGSLIRGTHGLFGFKTQLRFGHTTVTSIFSQQKTQSSTIEVAGGAQLTEFMIRADDYEANRHYFASQYFRNTYDRALASLPIVTSNINITRIEVWITNVGAATEDNRNIVAFADLGENEPHHGSLTGGGSQVPDNSANNLYEMMRTSPIRNISQVNSHLSGAGFVSGEDYENVENARRLRSNEYTFNPKLGFISLNRSINPDQVLAVAFQYTLIGDTVTYQVGEFSNEVTAPDGLIVKLLKSTAVNTNLPMWDLMMKNVYNLGSFQIRRDQFRLNVLYDSEELGVHIGYLDEGPATVKGQPLIRVMGLDRLNTQLDPIPDGVFDFIDGAATGGGTIEANNGRVYFPVVEPFGAHLRKMLEDDELGDKYAFDSLYTTTRYRAQQMPERNRWYIEGSFQSASGAEIPLNAMNVPPGSVVVTAGGVPLTENVDYTVDYSLGRVRIINEAILNSGTPIRISLESTDLFNLQTKTLLGTHVDHRISDNFNVGATIMRLSERPLTQKVNYGDEPIANTIWGLNTTYTTESQYITRILDRLPFYSTNTTSRITLNGEFAHLIPGHSRHIGSAGTAYIDDFEGSKSAIDLKNVQRWQIASTPQHQTSPGMFPEGALHNDLAFRFNVARLAWYVIDPLFTRNNNLTPSHIRNDVQQRSNHFVREVLETEIWPNKESPTGIPAPIPVLNMAFYPAERGPYNYDAAPSAYSSGMTIEGLLADPQTRWGGVMRGLPMTDFEAANIEYVEFWLMDPFVYSENHSGGDLYINLGDISEDVLRDGRKSFENGLPVSELVENVDTTAWGRVSTLPDLVNAFDNNPASREFQDIGLDGLRTEDERIFFNENFLQVIADMYGTSSAAYQLAWEDPSADNYQYYRGSDLDALEVSILERYKRYNGLEGNSPTSEQSPESYPTSASNIPNTEDINQDGTLSETERYYQYRISLRPQDMEVGRNYITDVMEASVRLANNEVERIRWYQFKVPLRDPNRQVIGNIQDFKSIRFMRMFFKDFQEPIICRFATLELIRGEWRTYDRELTEPGEYVPGNNEETTFDVFTVNIEENGQRFPIPYVLPPGIEREQDLGTTTMHQRNEQSLAMKVAELQDGDSRAVYKTANLDVRQYRRLKMFAHAEAVSETLPLNDGDLTVFIRLGSDFTGNYYEYEVPMRVTPWLPRTFNPEIIWPEENNFDVEFAKLQELKLSRNALSREADSGVSVNRPYSEFDGQNRMTIIGNPTLSNIQVIMIGIRNPKKTTATPDDDGLPKSAEIWVNELRLYDFNDQGGWAANARLNATLADLGNIALAGFVSTPGFGSIEQKVNERQQEEILTYDLATNLQLGLLLPESFGLRIPMHFSFSESISNPLYNPLNPDIFFEDDLATYETRAERDSLRRLAQDIVRRKSFNFTNVSFAGFGDSRRLYSIENFDFTYAYTEMYARNVNIEYDRRQTWRGAVNYNYNTTPRNVTPFSNVSLFQNDLLRLFREFNFYYLPRSVSFRTSMDRGYAESLMRAKSAGIVLLEPNYVKSFDWDRRYDIRWDLSRALRLEFNANTRARIDELPGSIYEDDLEHTLQEKRDFIRENILGLGRTTFYTHRLNMTYNVPINRLPLLDWVNANAGYAADFDWVAAHRAATELGNTIENSQTLRLNANANLVNLYNKVGFLQRINQQSSGGRGQQQGRGPQPPRQQEEPAERPNIARIIFERTFRMLMGVRNLSVNYTETNGIHLPGFTPEPSVLGMDWNLMAPGAGFLFGSQKDIRQQAAIEGWITDNPNLNIQYTQSNNKNLTLRSQVEPIRNMRIEVTAQRNQSRTHSEYFKADSLGVFDSFNPMERGSFSISFLALRTTFESVDKRLYTSQNFETFKENRFAIAMRLAQRNPNWNGEFDRITGYPIGYGPTSQDVLIPAFLSAYSGRDPEKTSLSPFLAIPMPNWRLTYDGLGRIPALQQWFRSFTIGHGYRSTFTLANFQSDLRYRESEDGFQQAMDMVNNNFYPEYEIAQVSINEQFNPLINVDITWQNNLMTRVEYRRSRDMSLSFANYQLTDHNSQEFIIGAGYRFQNLAFNINQGGRRQRIESDLVLRLDLSLRENKTILRKLQEDTDIISSGQQNIGMNFTAEYQLSPRVNFRFFFDRSVNNPFVSNQFPNTNTHGGFSLRFILI
ncbi:MAG: cell surface protein SprA [Bacteroidales bacterium]|nr:cell surface protein SprA [Bacteroidales bacterium]